MKPLRFTALILLLTTWALPSGAQVIPNITPLTFSLRSIRMQSTGFSVVDVHYDLDGDMTSHSVPEVFECNDLFTLPVSCADQVFRLREDLPNAGNAGLLKDNNIRKGIISSTKQTVDLHLAIQ